MWGQHSEREGTAISPEEAPGGLVKHNCLMAWPLYLVMSIQKAEIKPCVVFPEIITIILKFQQNEYLWSYLCSKLIFISFFLHLLYFWISFVFQSLSFLCSKFLFIFIFFSAKLSPSVCSVISSSNILNERLPSVICPFSFDSWVNHIFKLPLNKLINTKSWALKRRKHNIK